MSIVRLLRKGIAAQEMLLFEKTIICTADSSQGRTQQLLLKDTSDSRQTCNIVY